MSCSWSLPTRLLATKTSKLEKYEVPGAANTSPIEPRGNSSTVGLFSLLTAGVGEEATTGFGFIVFAGPLAPELPAPSTDEGGGTICEPSPGNEPKCPPAPELPVPSTDGGGGTIWEPPPYIEPKRPPAPDLPVSSTDGGGGTIWEPPPYIEPKRPPAPELPASPTDGGGGTTSKPTLESEPNLVPAAEPPAP